MKNPEAEALSTFLRHARPDIFIVRNAKSGEVENEGYDLVLPSILTPIQLLRAIGHALAGNAAQALEDE